MGVVDWVDFEKYPEQGTWVGKTVEVVFNFDTSKSILGRIIRDDREKPFLTILQLEDGRVLLATEYQYSPKLNELPQKLSFDPMYVAIESEATLREDRRYSLGVIQPEIRALTADEAIVFVHLAKKALRFSPRT